MLNCLYFITQKSNAVWVMKELIPIDTDYNTEYISFSPQYVQTFERIKQFFKVQILKLINFHLPPSALPHLLSNNL